MDDAGDYVYADYEFDAPAGGGAASRSFRLTLTHDDNGNLIDDGLFKYTYDPWNP